VIVGLWWQWQISDVSAYYQATQNNAQAIETQLQDAVSKNLQATFKQKTLSQWLNADYNSSLLPISQAAVKSLGVKVIAVGVTDMDLSKQSTTTANTRQAKAENDAAAALQEGSAARAQAISAAADAKAQLIIANAQIEADKIRAAGSQQASAVYLAAYQAAPEFYNFYQTLQAYKKALTNPNAVFILPPSGDFFKYLNKVPASAASGSH
jgi:membrane protease subunit HflC